MVECLEELVGVGVELLAGLEAKDTEVVFLKDELVDASYLIGDWLACEQLVLLPAALDVETEALNKADVVFGIVEGGEVLTGIEIVDDPAFLVHVGEAERSFYLVHSFGFAPFDDLVDECGADVEILDEVEPTETYGFLIPTFIDGVIDDTCYTAYDLVVAIG